MYRYDPNKSEQTVQTQIRLLLGAVWSGSTQFAILLHLLGALLYGKAVLFKFQGDYSNFLGVRNLLDFYGIRGQTLILFWSMKSVWEKWLLNKYMYINKFEQTEYNVVDWAIKPQNKHTSYYKKVFKDSNGFSLRYSAKILMRT